MSVPKLLRTKPMMHSKQIQNLCGQFQMSWFCFLILKCWPSCFFLERKFYREHNADLHPSNILNLWNYSVLKFARICFAISIYYLAWESWEGNYQDGQQRYSDCYELLSRVVRVLEFCLSPCYVKGSTASFRSFTRRDTVGRNRVCIIRRH